MCLFIIVFIDSTKFIQLNLINLFNRIRSVDSAEYNQLIQLYNLIDMNLNKLTITGNSYRMYL